MPLFREIVDEAGMGFDWPDSCGEVEVGGVNIDSRNIEPGDIFVALRGEKRDGMDHAEDAVARGASLILCGGERDAVSLKYPVPVCHVEDAADAAGRIARAMFRSFRHGFELWGVTGTNGKTTITYLLESLFMASGHIPGVIGTIEQRVSGWSAPSRLTTPDVVTLHRLLGEMQDRGADRVALEVSSHALSQGRVAGCRFAVAIFTNLSRDHLDYHQDMESYFQAKAKLFTDYGPELSVINLDDAYGRRLWNMIQGRKIGYGMESDADVRPVWWNSDFGGINMKVSTPQGVFPLFVNMNGRHNVMNVLAVVAAAAGSDITSGRIRAGLERAVMAPGRMQPVNVNVPFRVFVDYAHTPDALRTVLASARENLGSGFSGDCNGKLLCVVGCGGDRDRGKRPVMGQIAARYADIVVLTSDNPRNEEPLAIIKEMLAGIPDESRAGIYTVPDRREAIERAVSMADRGDVILVAGKGHETFQVRGGKQYHFDDVEEIERACASLGGLNMGDHSLSSGFSASCSASDVVAATGGSLVAGSGNRGFSGVSTDSRSIREGELFWALDGEHFKGSDFVADALGRGAAGAVVGGNGPCDTSWASAGDRFVIAVDDTLEALGDFAAWHGRKTGARVIGITGSCGKTGVKELLSMVMSMKYRTLATSGNFNNLIGLPLTLLQAGREHEWVVLEMGMNVPGEIKRLCEIAAPEAGVITSILPAHLEGLGGIEEVCREKSWLWKMMPADGICVLNLDDELCVRAADESGLEDITGYTLERDTAKAEALAARAGAARLVQAVAWKLRPDRTELVLEADRERFEIKSRLSGLVNVRNVLCAASAALALGVEPELVATGIEKAGPVRGRLHVERIGGNVLIDDTYNANPASMAAALEFLGEIKGESRGVAILGDMFELGRDEKRYHLELGERAAATGLDLLVCAGRLGALIAEGAMRAGMAEKRIRVFPDVDSLIKWRGFREMFCAENTALTILVKGSRGMAMERVVKKIQDRRADS